MRHTLLRLLYPLTLLLLIAGGSVFVYKNSRPRPPPPQPFHTSQSMSSTFSIIGAPAARPATAPTSRSTSAEAAWLDLIDNIESDADSVALASRLFGGLPTQIVTAKGPGAQNSSFAQSNPDAGYYVAIRVGHFGGNEIIINDLKLYRPNLTIGLVCFIPDMRRTLAGVNRYPSGTTGSPENLITILADDYFLRHGQPWSLTHIDVVKPATNPTAFRNDLNKRIDQFISQNAAYYAPFQPQ
jgi:hypothetical protein